MTGRGRVTDVKVLGERKKRETNFNIAEKAYLVDLVEARFNIIENKRTDGVSVGKKIKEWEEIAEDFNAQSINVLRSWSTLRNAWDNLKKLVKKLITQENVNRIRTGGGPSVIPNVRPEERPLYEKVRALLYPIGLHNIYDNDVCISSAHIENDVEGDGDEIEMTENVPVQIEKPINGDWSSYSSSDMRQPRTRVLRELPLCSVSIDNNGQAEMDLSQFLDAADDVEQITVIGSDQDPYVFENPSQPISTVPVESVSSAQNNISHNKGPKSSSSPSTRHKSANRRRPIISQTKNDELMEVKIKALSSANEYAAEQHQLIMKIYKEKLKQESLRTQMMEKKLKELKSTRNSRSDDSDSFS